MKLRRNLLLVKGAVDMTPLIDVVFLLLVFFMLSRSFILQPGLRIEIPRSLWGQGIQTNNLVITVLLEAEKRDPVTGTVMKREPLYFFNDEHMSLETLRTSLKKIRPGKNSATLVLKSDQAVPNGVVVNLMNLALSQGFSVVLATQAVEDASRP